MILEYRNEYIDKVEYYSVSGDKTIDVQDIKKYINDLNFIDVNILQILKIIEYTVFKDDKYKIVFIEQGGCIFLHIRQEEKSIFIIGGFSKGMNTSLYDHIVWSIEKGTNFTDKKEDEKRKYSSYKHRWGYELVKFTKTNEEELFKFIAEKLRPLKLKKEELR